MLGREHDVAGAEQGIRAGGEHSDRAGGGGKRHLRAAGAADPVALHGLDLLRPIQKLQVVEQAIRVGGDAHHPLAQALAEDREIAALRTPIGGDFLVGQHRAQARAPVDHGVGEVDEAELIDRGMLFRGGEIAEVAAVLCGASARHQIAHEILDRTGFLLLLVEPGVINLQEDPLRPTVKLRIRRSDGAAAVMPQAQRVELAGHVRDVRLGGRARVRTCLDRVLFRRQPKGVVAQGVQNVLAQHAVVTGENIRGDVAQRVSHVQACAGGVGKHVLDVELVSGQLLTSGEVTHRVRCIERTVVHPVALPFLLNLVGHSRRISECRPLSRVGHG